MKVFIKGLNSCAMRKAELQYYRNILLENGDIIVNDPRKSDAILLWTCGFRKDVRDNSITEIKRYLKDYDAELIVAGCLPDISPEMLKEVFNGRVINWRDDKKKMKEIFGCNNSKCDLNSFVFAEEKLCSDIEKYRKENPNNDATFHDQFMKLLVSEGCNYKCSYCSERLAFPPYRSIPEDVLHKACSSMIKKTGYSEVILLADSLGDYGCDINSNLPTLILNLKKIHPELKIALNNLNPASFIKYFDKFVKFLEKGDIKHLNLPIQSASERILKLMNRPYNRMDIDKIFGMLNKIKFKEFDTHLIIGFPGEKQVDFEETLEFVLKYKPKYVLASGFMESPTMEACKLSDKIDEVTKKKRLKIIEESLKRANIICNTDDSELGLDRKRRLNIV